MADKPFALIGVNSDRKERVLEAIQRENITWRSFWDGGSTGGPIAKAWGVHAWPTIYFIDDRGVIRDKNKRGAAMDRVVDELVQEALARMHELAQDEDPAVRSLAAFRMGRYNAPKARETLVKLIKDGSSLVRRRAAVGLALLGEPVKPHVGLIRTAMDDDRGEIRAAALRVLADLGDAQLPSLAQRGLQDRDAQVRRAAVQALKGSKDPQAVDWLVRATADSDRQTAEAAVFTLGTISSKRARTALKTLSEDPQHPLRVWIAVAMHRQGQPGTASRFQKLLQDKDVTIRRQAADALATLEKFDPTDLLIKALEDQDGLVRRTATTALGNSSNPKAKKAVKNYLRRKVDELLPLLTGSDRRKQYEARKKLQMLGPPAAPLLLDQLEKTSSPTSRTLAYMIGGMRNAEVLPRVVATLRQPNLPKDRRTTFELVLLGMGEEAAEAATELLADGSDAVRESGARVLARVGGEAAADKLKAALKDKSAKVRAYAAMGLSARQDPQALKVLEEAMRSRDAEVRNVALSALARYDSQTVLPLVRPLVETADTATAQNLLFVLSNFREAEATEGIVRLTQKHPSLANFSIYSLRRQGTPAAAQALGRLLDHKDRRVQQAARAALQRMPLPEAREILKRAEQKKAAEKTTAPKIAPKRAK